MKRFNEIIDRRGLWWVTERVADYFGIEANNLNDFDVFEYSKKHNISEDYLIDILKNDENLMLEYLAKLIADYGRDTIAYSVLCVDRFETSRLYKGNGRCEVVFSFKEKAGELTLEEYMVEIGANVRYLKEMVESWELDD